MMKEQFPFSQFVGVDVSKAKLDFAFADDSQAFSIENSEEPIVDTSKNPWKLHKNRSKQSISGSPNVSKPSIFSTASSGLKYGLGEGRVLT